jgi:hypothetical protein
MMREPENPDLPRPHQPLTNEQFQPILELFRMISEVRLEVVYFRSCIALADTGFRETQSLLRARREADSEKAAQANFYSRIVRHWPTIADHSAISSLFYFRKHLSTIEDWLRISGAHDMLSNPAFADEALALFDKQFPRWRQTRNATAPSADMRVKKEALNFPLVRKSQGTSVLVMGSFEGRTFVTTRYGEVLRFDVTWETYQRLLEVYDLLRSGLSLSPTTQSPESPTTQSPDHTGRRS